MPSPPLRSSVGGGDSAYRSCQGSARTSEEHPQYIEAKKFAELIGQKGWMVITGAGEGIMRAGELMLTPDEIAEIEGAAVTAVSR